MHIMHVTIITEEFGDKHTGEHQHEKRDRYHLGPFGKPHIPGTGLSLFKESIGAALNSAKIRLTAFLHQNNKNNQK